MQYTVRFTRTVAGIVARLHPDVKKEMKAAIKKIAREPNCGKALQEELADFLSYRFRRYRIIYQLNDIDKTIIIVMISHRRDVYDLFTELLDRREKMGD